MEAERPSFKPARHVDWLAQLIVWLFLKGAGSWENATWSWALYETKNHNTRLVSRLRLNYKSNSILESAMYKFQEITEIFMMRTCLLGIKLRVESLEKLPKNNTVRNFKQFIS